MRTSSPSISWQLVAGIALTGAQLLYAASDARAQAPAPAPAKSPAQAGDSPSPNEAWVYGLPATRVGDARPWLDETVGGRWWVNPEYLFFSVRREHLPGAIVTTGNPNAS